MADITDERLRELSQGATIYGHERNAIAAELLAAREKIRADEEALLLQFLPTTNAHGRRRIVMCGPKSL